MKKRIVILSLIIIVLVSTGLSFILKKNNNIEKTGKKEIPQQQEPVKEQIIIPEEKKENNCKDTDTKIKQNESITSNIEKKTNTSAEIKINESKKESLPIINSNTSTEKEKEEETPEEKKEEIPEEKKEETPQQQEPVKEQIIIPEEKINPWDKLGISEYDYYNKPDHSWAEVNFSIKDYGTQELTLKACQDYGNSYILEHGGGYFCYSVNSYSGNYLGEDFDYYN